MRLEYIDYGESVYEQIRAWHMMPKPYYSLRTQIDPLSSIGEGGGVFT